MTTSKNIIQHLFYSGGLLVLIQAVTVVGGTLLGGTYPNLWIILAIAFDCALILFAIGIVRVGIENRKAKFWLPISILLVFSALSDLAVVIMFFIIGGEAAWGISPMIFVRLALLLAYFLTLACGFSLNKFLFDNLLTENDVNRKADILLPVGLVVLIFPAIIDWYAVFIFPQEVVGGLLTAAIVLYLLAEFVVILGYFQLVSNLNLIRMRDRVIELSSEDHDDREDNLAEEEQK